VLTSPSLKDEVLETSEELADGIVATHLSRDESPVEWDWRALDDALFRQFSLRLNLPESEQERLKTEDVQQLVVDRVREIYEQKEQAFTTPVLRHLEKVIMLQAIDTLWKDHLLAMDHLKEGIGLRGYGQKNPLQEYQKEGFDMFQDLMNRLDADIVEKLYTVQLAREEDVERMEQKQQQRTAKLAMTHGGEPAAAQPEVVKRDAPKVGRNDPCVCGSGKKYKKCCGAAH
jgi:preprotein translocase subunit SecA